MAHTKIIEVLNDELGHNKNFNPKSIKIRKA